jgi:hypothetical protein
VASVEVQDAFFVEGSYGGGAGINGNTSQSRQISGRNGKAWIFGIACANARSRFEHIGEHGGSSRIVGARSSWEKYA